MTIPQAIAHVNAEIQRIERANPNGIPKPWEKDACPDSTAWWGFVQQRIALSNAHPEKRLCCAGLNLEAKAPSEAQKRAREAAGDRLRLAKASV